MPDEKDPKVLLKDLQSHTKEFMVVVRNFQKSLLALYDVAPEEAFESICVAKGVIVALGTTALLLEEIVESEMQEALDETEQEKPETKKGQNDDDLN